MKAIVRIFAAALLVSLAMNASAAYPDRPITMIVPWGAGGGTDAVARFFAAYLEKDLGQPVNVVNRTGGNGVVGHSAIAQAAADGYTIGLITVEISMMHWQGLTELTPASYQPLALVNADPAGFQVRADSPYKSVKDVIDASKVKSLAIFADKAPALYPNLPTIKQATGSSWQTAAWRGFAMPKGASKDVVDKLTASIQKAYESKEYKDFLTQRGFGGEWARQDDFAKYMAKG